MYGARQARTHPDQTALVMATGGQSLTYAAYEARANQVANFFRQAGLQRGDHISIFMENNLEMLVLEGGAERSGLYFTLINAYLAPDEVAYIIDNSRSRIFFTSAAKLDVAEQAIASLGPERRLERAFVGAPASPPTGWESIDEAIDPMPTEPRPDQALGAAMLYSSGTTGRPKGILRPLAPGAPSDELPVMAFVKAMFGFREGMVYLNPAPLYHSAPQASVSAALRLGATVVVMEHFDAEQWLRLVERYRVTHCQMVPTMFSRLLRLPEDVRNRYDLSSLETIVHAAAPCPVPVKKAMIEWLGPVITEYYGATEGNGFTFCNSEEWLGHPGTVGRCILGELLILDDDGNECPVGTDGTIWFRGATNFEYFEDREKTEANRRDGGATSTVGDVGHLDADGYLYLTDRKTYMIISGGVNIYPQETENLLVTHPDVLDAAVIGVPNDDLGEEVKAVVQLVDRSRAGPEMESRLIAFCRSRLAHFKCPRTVDFVDELPRLPTGKLYKRLVRDRYWEGHGTVIV